MFIPVGYILGYSYSELDRLYGIGIRLFANYLLLLSKVELVKKTLDISENCSIVELADIHE